MKDKALGVNPTWLGGPLRGAHKKTLHMFMGQFRWRLCIAVITPL